MLLPPIKKQTPIPLLIGILEPGPLLLNILLPKSPHHIHIMLNLLNLLIYCLLFYHQRNQCILSNRLA